MKITDSDINSILGKINTELARQKTQGQISVDYIRDQPRPDFLVGGKSVAYLAKRDTRKKVFNWLTTFFEGLTFVRDWLVYTHPDEYFGNENSDKIS